MRHALLATYFIQAMFGWPRAQCGNAVLELQ
jgi:hypothetical protein